METYNEKIKYKDGLGTNVPTAAHYVINPVRIRREPSFFVSVKKLDSRAVIPTYAKDGDAGLDLTIMSIEEIDSRRVRVRFGLAFEIPVGYFGMIVPRSSIYKTNHLLSNSAGIIDSGYRGEVGAIFYKEVDEAFSYKVGDRAAQMIILHRPNILLNEVKELSESERGVGGFGSSGR